MNLIPSFHVDLLQLLMFTGSCLDALNLLLLLDKILTRSFYTVLGHLDSCGLIFFILINDWDFTCWIDHTRKSFRNGILSNCRAEQTKSQIWDTKFHNCIWKFTFTSRQSFNNRLRLNAISVSGSRILFSFSNHYLQPKPSLLWAQGMWGIKLGRGNAKHSLKDLCVCA